MISYEEKYNVNLSIFILKFFPMSSHKNYYYLDNVKQINDMN